MTATTTTPAAPAATPTATRGVLVRWLGAPTVAVCKRELRAYFNTPLGYLIIAVFLASAAFLTFTLDGIYELREASLRAYFSWFPILFAFFAPAIAMRTWAEERRSGTVELLFTLPITVSQAVLGKFLASWVILGVMLVLSWSMVFTIAYLGDPDYGPIFGGYFGAFLMAGAYLAIGSCFSALVRNQIIALVLGVLVCLLFVASGTPGFVGGLEAIGVPGFAVAFVESMSFLTHYDVMQRGALEFSDVFFMIAIITGFLYATGLILNEFKSR